MRGPNRSISIAGGACPKRPGRGLEGERDREAQWPIGFRDGGPGNRPHQTPLYVAGGWARKTAGGSRVSGAVAHLSKSRRAARWRDAIANRPPDAGYRRPQARRRMRQNDQPTSRCSFLFPIEQTEAAAFVLLGRCCGVTRVISSWWQKHLSPLPLTT